ncbi:hypothetical protein MNBD_GAMMA01-1148, partial [hydrothermal vent metagenome]
MGKLQLGDSLLVSELSRLGRSMLECMEILSIAMDKSFALYYLLVNDFEFTKLVANEINTENLRYVSQSALVVADIYIYICQNDPSSCSEKSSRMLQICLFEKEYCNIDFIGYLEKNHTLNEVNDFYNILDAARKLLD